MDMLTKAKAYVLKFVTLAQSKATTYIALATAGLSELTSQWDAAAAIMPHFLVAHKAHIFAAASLLPIWSRIRRELSGK